METERRLEQNQQQQQRQPEVGCHAFHITSNILHTVNISHGIEGRQKVQLNGRVLQEGVILHLASVFRLIG